MKNKLPSRNSSSSSGASDFSAILRKPAFMTLLLSEGLSLTGDRLIMIALVTLVYNSTQSSSAVSLFMILKTIPTLVMASLAGVFVDRWNRKGVMVCSNFIQCLLVLLIPVTNNLVVVFVAYLAMSIVSQFFIPARSAVIPSLVPSGLLLRANSLFAIAFVGAMAIGPAIGGWLTDQYGLNAAFYVDAATFLVPALAVGLLKIPRNVPLSTQKSFGASWREGLAYVSRNADILAALALIPAVFVIIGCISVLGIVIVQDQVNGSASSFGMMMSALGIGIVFGAIAMNLFGGRFDCRRMAAVGAVMAGIAAIAMSLAGSFVTLVLCAAGIGLGMVIVQANGQTILQKVPEDLRGRILGQSQALMGCATFIAAAFSGLLADWVGAGAVLASSGLLVLIVGVMAYSRFEKRLKLNSGQ